MVGGGAAMLLLSIVAAAAQTPRPVAQPQRIEIRAQAVEAFDPRDASLKKFGALIVSRRTGADLTAFAVRRHLSATHEPRRRAPAGTDRPGLLAAGPAGPIATARRSPSRKPNWRRSSGRTAVRSARAQLVSTPKRSPTTAARSTSASSASTKFCASITARTACARAASRSACRRHQAAANNRGIECLVCRRKGSRSPAR
jgi:hypothetical protein